MTITAYRLGYDEGPGTSRAFDAYVAAHDPLRGTVGGADVAFGVDPGTYFCGGLTRWIAESGLPGGFVHIPPGDHHETTHALVSRLLELLRPHGQVLVTGFGPFPGVAWNPSGAYVATRGDGRVLELAGASDMAPVIAQLGGRYDAILALGVDSRQRLPRPRYTIETQARGMGDPAAAWVAAEGLAQAVWAAGAFTCRGTSSSRSWPRR